MQGKTAEISLLWAPKIPSFTTEAKIELTEPGGLQSNHKGKSDSQLMDGLFVLPRDPIKLKKLLRKDRTDTAGSKWFDMPAPAITPEIKRDLEILKLRKVIDPKRHYKKAGANSKALPKYFQIGTVIESSSEYFSSRLTKKERKASFAEELLSDPNVNAYRKRKIREIEKAKQPGGNSKWKNRGTSGQKRGKKARKAIL